MKMILIIGVVLLAGFAETVGFSDIKIREKEVGRFESIGGAIIFKRKDFDKLQDLVEKAKKNDADCLVIKNYDKNGKLMDELIVCEVRFVK